MINSYEALNNNKKVTDEGIKRVEITDSNTLVESPYSTVVIVDQKQVLKVGYNKAEDNIYSEVNINGTKQQIKEEAQGKRTKPLQRITSVDDSDCMNKLTKANVQALDKLAMIKKSQDKTRLKASKCTTNESHHDGIRFIIDKANTMADENAAVSMGNVRLKTKL